MADDFRVPVFVSWGRWVARCPRPGCHNAEQFGRCDDGTIGGLTGDRFVCREDHGGCGFACRPDWPTDVDGIEFMLQARPVAARNWLPGEDVSDLLRENVEHWLIPTHELNVVNGHVEVLAPIEAPARRGQIEER